MSACGIDILQGSCVIVIYLGNGICTGLRVFCGETSAETPPTYDFERTVADRYRHRETCRHSFGHRQSETLVTRRVAHQIVIFEMRIYVVPVSQSEKMYLRLDATLRGKHLQLRQRCTGSDEIHRYIVIAARFKRCHGFYQNILPLLILIEASNLHYTKRRMTKFIATQGNGIDINTVNNFRNIRIAMTDNFIANRIRDCE